MYLNYLFISPLLFHVILLTVVSTMPALLASMLLLARATIMLESF